MNHYRRRASPGGNAGGSCRWPPALRKTLYALGLGDRVVGVTQFCQYPPDVKDKARVGNLLDPNFEAILALKPDLVIAIEEQSPAVEKLSRLKVETLVVNHKTIEGIVESFRDIGRVCGKGPEGRRLEKKYASVPDPRFIWWVEDLAHTLHPELDQASRGGQSHFCGENPGRQDNVQPAAKTETVPSVPEDEGN